MAEIQIAKQEDLTKVAEDLELAKQEWEGIEIPDISGLATKEEVNAKADSNHTHSWNDIEDKPSIPDTSGLATKEEVEGKADSGHTHNWSEIEDKPSIPDVSGLATKAEVEGKADVSQISELEGIIGSLTDRIVALEEALNDENEV